MSEKWVALRETRLDVLADLSRQATSTEVEKTIEDIIEDFTIVAAAYPSQAATIEEQAAKILELEEELAEWAPQEPDPDIIPTEWEFASVYPSTTIGESTQYIVPSNGWYSFHIIGDGGDGGAAGRSGLYTLDDDAAYYLGGTGGSGASGAYANWLAYLTQSSVVTFLYDGENVSLKTPTNIIITSPAGGNGGNGSDVDTYAGANGGAGGEAATAFVLGGELTNLTLEYGSPGMRGKTGSNLGYSWDSVTLTGQAGATTFAPTHKYMAGEDIEGGAFEHSGLDGESILTGPTPILGNGGSGAGNYWTLDTIITPPVGGKGGPGGIVIETAATSSFIPAGLQNANGVSF